MRINGIGTMWLGATAREGNRCFATLWFTFVFAPLIPIRRAKLELLPHQGAGFTYRELEKTALDGRETLSGRSPRCSARSAFPSHFSCR
jgi:hypothetical protein